MEDVPYDIRLRMAGGWIRERHLTARLKSRKKLYIYRLLTLTVNMPCLISFMLFVFHEFYLGYYSDPLGRRILTGLGIGVEMLAVTSTIVGALNDWQNWWWFGAWFASCMMSFAEVLSLLTLVLILHVNCSAQTPPDRIKFCDSGAFKQFCVFALVYLVTTIVRFQGAFIHFIKGRYLK